jgi:hypothetical protein
MWYPNNRRFDMNPLQELLNINDARVIIANKRAALPKGWADQGSILDRARQILDHAQDYLRQEGDELGTVLNSLVP